MKIYDYILQTEKIELFDVNRANSARYIVEIKEVNEFIIPCDYTKNLITNLSSQKYFKEQLKKNPKDYYILPTKFEYGIHCSYIEKSNLSDIIDKISKLNFDWVSPFYFAMEILEVKSFENGKLYINIGDYIYRLEVINKNIISYYSYLKEGYFSHDMKNVDFFKKSIIWIEGEHI